jgi:hypothetical protein
LSGLSRSDGPIIEWTQSVSLPDWTHH